MSERTSFGSLLLSVLALMATAMSAGCASSGADPTEPGEASRTMRQLVLPLSPLEASKAGSRTFDASGVRGSIATDGAWALRAEVVHTRLRCASYSATVRFGSGNQDCSRVDWLTPAEVGPPRRHCNAATVVHSSAGTLSVLPTDLQQLNCAEVAVRCTGVCG